VEYCRLAHEKAPKLSSDLHDPLLPRIKVLPWSPAFREQSIRNFIQQIVSISDVSVQCHGRHAQIGGETSDGHLFVVTLFHHLNGGVNDLLARHGSPMRAFVRLGDFVHERCRSGVVIAGAY
jgi:hypothetical protein